MYLPRGEVLQLNESPVNDLATLKLKEKLPTIDLHLGLK